MSETTAKSYKVVDDNQIWVAGERVRDDRTVDLTEDQARYLLLSGEITLAGTEVATQPSKPSRKSVEG